MSAPKFAVGEVVILQSETAPELNDEYQVLSVISPGERVLVGGVQKINDSSFTYELGVVGPSGHGFWCESALRKRHQPGEHTFEALMASLNAPVSRDQLARLEREVAHG